MVKKLFLKPEIGIFAAQLEFSNSEWERLKIVVCPTNLILKQEERSGNKAIKNRS